MGPSSSECGSDREISFPYPWELFIFSLLSSDRTEKHPMAATLSLLRLPFVSQRSNRTRSNLLNLPNPAKSMITSSSSEPERLLLEATHHLKSAALPFSALTLPFLLDSKVGPVLQFFSVSSTLFPLPLCCFVLGDLSRMH